MPRDLNHVLVTRFNLPSAGAERFTREREGWLRGRVELFDRYCKPSVAAQSERDFTWVIYFDPESPDWLKERIARDERDGRYRPLFRERVTPAGLVADLAATQDERRAMLLTTNLDNDDGLATDFVARLQDTAARRDGRTALYLGRGLIGAPSGVYLRTDRYNAFCSVIEPWDGAVTCWADWHNRLPRSMPAVVEAGAPAWLQVVHGTNVSNRVRGHLVAPDRYRPAFGGLLAGWPQPPHRDVVRDRCFGAPTRALREIARSTAKNVVLALGGKRGLDRVKAALAARNRGADERNV